MWPIQILNQIRFVATRSSSKWIADFFLLFYLFNSLVKIWNTRVQIALFDTRDNGSTQKVSVKSTRTIIYNGKVRPMQRKKLWLASINLLIMRVKNNQKAITARRIFCELVDCFGRLYIRHRHLWRRRWLRRRHPYNNWDTKWPSIKL